MPHFFSRVKIECEDPTSNNGIVKIKIRERKIRVPIIGGPSPFTSTQRTAVSDAMLPHESAVIVRVDGINHARLLRQQKNALAVCERSQHRRRAEIVVISATVGTVILLFRHAPGVPNVLRGELPRP